MPVLFLDCANGATSAMIVSALADAGLKPSSLEWELSNINLGDFHMHFDRREREGKSGIAFSIHAGSTHSHDAHGNCCGDHDHDHETDSGKSLEELRSLISASELSERVQTVALGIFERLAAAEAKAQGVTPETARLNEGGTLDGIAHVIAVAVGLEALGIDRVIVSPLREGKGWVQNASGSSEIPSPVTLEVLKEAPLTVGGESFQLLPPLAAAILVGIADEFGERPASFQAAACGHGINPRRFPPLPNIVTAEIG